jgi:hypothetical protein
MEDLKNISLDSILHLEQNEYKSFLSKLKVFKELCFEGFNFNLQVIDKLIYENDVAIKNNENLIKYYQDEKININVKVFQTCLNYFKEKQKRCEELKAIIINYFI